MVVASYSIGLTLTELSLVKDRKRPQPEHARTRVYSVEIESTVRALSALRSDHSHVPLTCPLLWLAESATSWKTDRGAESCKDGNRGSREVLYGVLM